MNRQLQREGDDMGDIHVVTAANNKYAKPLGVMIYSLLKHAGKPSRIRIYVMESDLSDKSKRRISNIAAAANAQIHFLSVEKSLFKGFKESRHITKETYYRMLIPKLLGKEVSKALYLDSDIIVKKDISKLWKTNIDDYYLAAVQKKDLKKKRKKKLGIPKNARYFNAGVLLINLEKWRKHHVAKKILRFSRENKSSIRFCSQDPMNAILHGKWLKINRRWNFTTSHARLYPKTRPFIIHYTGKKKPWKHKHVFRKDYKRYYKSIKSVFQ